jgi:NAD(P)-dependent dehydrogenase (short-subunit alcohol dehydrogenase family)
MRTVVTGANRGIGLELVRQLRDRGEQVEACARRPGDAHELARLAGDRVRIHPLDVTDPASVRALATSLGDAAIDILFNVAGIYRGRHHSLDEMADDLALDDVVTTYDVNATGALRIVVALLPHVRRGTARKLVHVSSNLSSISDNASGGEYAYRMSKAALNMMSRSLAVDLRGDGITSVVINPGWVQTDMGGPGAPTPVADSVRAILREVDRATLADSGEFLNWRGNRHAW